MQRGCAYDRRMLEDVVAALRCPVCEGGLRVDGRTLRCDRGHAFDLARQGHANLLASGRDPGTGDTAAMVAARETLLGAGRYATLSAALGDAAVAALEGGPPGVVLDVGAGTGHHLAAVLERLPGRAGIALDLSRHAARRAARIHPRVGAVVADAWQGLPVRTGSVALVLDVFAPRSGAEMRRVLAPGGSALVVTPTQAHLAELVEPLGLLRVDVHKEERLSTALDRWLEPVSASRLAFELRLDRTDAERVVAMGPSAHHLAPDELRERIARLPEPLVATASVILRRYRPR